VPTGPSAGLRPQQQKPLEKLGEGGKQGRVRLLSSRRVRPLGLGEEREAGEGSSRFGEEVVATSTRGKTIIVVVGLEEDGGIGLCGNKFTKAQGQYLACDGEMRRGRNILHQDTRGLWGCSMERETGAR